MKNDQEHQQAYLQLFALASEQNVELGALRRLVGREHYPSRNTDSPSQSSYSERMNDLTREEINAKLETIEVRMDARVESVSAKIDGFLAAQSERDKRYELLAERVTKAAEGAEEAAKQAATVKSNYWAAVIVQLLAVVAILVGGYFANQANVLGAMQTTMAAMQAGKDQPTSPAPPPNLQRKN